MSSSSAENRTNVKLERHLRKLTGALVGARRRFEQFDASLSDLIASEDAGLLLEYWAREKVVALAVERANELGIQRAEWAQLNAQLRQLSLQRGALLELELLRIARILDRAGIPALSIKGPLMADALYGDRRLRWPSGDIDLVVPQERLLDASSLLQAHGWNPPRDALIDGYWPELHLDHAGEGATPDVEVHWRVQWYDRIGQHTSFLFAAADLQQGILRPSPTAELSILLLNYARDGFHTLRLAADVAAWFDTYGRDHWDSALATFAAGPLVRPHLISAAAVSLVAGTPRPEATPTDWRARAAHSIARADRRLSAREEYSQVVFVDLLVSPRRTVRERFSTAAFRSSAVLAAKHPRHVSFFPARVLRTASFARTLADLPATVLAARTR